MKKPTDKEVLAAIRKSKKHWRENCHSSNLSILHISSRGCALCVLCSDDVTNRCYGCPLGDDTECCAEWRDVYDAIKNMNQMRAKLAARKMHRRLCELEREYMDKVTREIIDKATEEIMDKFTERFTALFSRAMWFILAFAVCYFAAYLFIYEMGIR